ncbi:MAG: MATE family efflux transporter [Christensenellales bacterium]
MSEKQEQQNTERSRMLGTMEMRKLVPTVSVPIMVSMLVQALYNIVDGIFVGQYSPDALTAVNLAMPMQMLMIAVSTGMGTGINSLISRRLGEKRPHDARDAARHGILIEVVGWLLFVIVGLFFARAYIGMTNPKAEVLEMGTLYLRIVCTLSLGQFMSICFERMMQATGNTTLSMITQLSGAVTNIILDPILIFSCQMGIAGAAVATVIGQVVSCTAGFVLNQWKNRELRLTHEGFRFDWKTVQNILVVGIPSTIMQAISSVCTTLMNMILAGFGDIYVNVLGVYFKLQSFVFMPVFGLCNGMVPIVGYNFGAQKKKRVYECVRVCLVYALVIMAVGTLLFLAVPNLLMMPFDSSADKALTAEGCVALRIICSHFLIAAAGITLSTVFQAVGRGTYSLIMSLCRQLIVLLPAAWALSPHRPERHLVGVPDCGNRLADDLPAALPQVRPRTDCAAAGRITVFILFPDSTVPSWRIFIWK